MWSSSFMLILLRYIGWRNYLEVVKHEKNNYTFYYFVSISDKLSGVDGALKATILGEATIQGLNVRTVENELQALVRDKKVSLKKEGGNWLYRLVQDEPEPSSN